jgi:hypothetical protein
MEQESVIHILPCQKKKEIQYFVPTTTTHLKILLLVTFSSLREILSFVTLSKNNGGRI